PEKVFPTLITRGSPSVWASAPADWTRKFLLPSHRKRCMLLLLVGHRRNAMGGKNEVWQGTLALMVLKTLETMGPQHGYGLARRIEQTSGGLLELNYGTLYPALLKLEQEGYIKSKWGASENNRKAKFYELTKAGQRQVKKAADDWEQ